MEGRRSTPTSASVSLSLSLSVSLALTLSHSLSLGFILSRTKRSFSLSNALLFRASSSLEYDNDNLRSDLDLPAVEGVIGRLPLKRLRKEELEWGRWREDKC